MTIKITLQWFIVWLVGTTLNFGIFLISYKHLAFPYLHEEQRVENAPYIFGYVLPAIMMATLITIIIFSVIAKRKAQ